MNPDPSAAGSANPPLQTVELQTGEAPGNSIVWLHGLGADGHDFEPIVPELGVSEPTRFVFPHAEERAVTLNGGMRMRAWFDLAGADFQQPADARGVESSIAQVTALVEREIERGVAAERIVVAGFSQGGAIAAHVALRFPRRLGGLIALSTWALLPRSLQEHRSEANARMPVFVGHGTHDPMVPPALGEGLAQGLRALGHTVTWRTYPVGHGVAPGEVRDIGAWLGERWT